MDRNSGWLPTKTDSNYHSAGSVEGKMSEKSLLKISYFCKIIILFNILK